MDSDFHHIFYVSRSLTEPEGLEAILLRARETNRRRGVTGALIHTGGHFAQLLEGTSEAVLQTMARIEGDPRHEQITRLSFGATGQRRCNDWSMAFLWAPGADDLMQKLLSTEMTPDRAERLQELLLEAASRSAKSAR